MKKQPPVQFDIGLNVNQQGKPAIDCHFTLPRLLGTFASLSSQLSVSSLIAHSFNVTYSLPGKWIFSAQLVKQVNDFHSSSSFSEQVTGVGVSWTRGSHRIGLDAHLRDIHPLVGNSNSKSTTASEQVRRSALRTIKTGINYKYVLDRQVGKTGSSSPHPVGGYKLSFLSDLCGLFGDVRFTKLESSFQINRKLFFFSDNVVLHSRIAAGAIAPLSVRGGQTPIQDRFFLGGTNEEKSSLRGFGFRGIGPCGKRVSSGPPLYDHLGGDAYLSLDNVVSFPIYSKDGLEIRGMLFANAGSLTPTLHSKVLQDLGSNARVSIGAGVVVPIGSVGTMEITVGKPVFGAMVTDTTQILQIGVRLSSYSL